jgi:hypothetical protein
MASIHHTRKIATLFVATTTQGGYPASNVGNPYLARPWVATTTSGATEHEQHFPVAGPVKSLHVHDVNFAAATVYKSVDGVAWVLVGALATYMGIEGRRRGKILVNDANVKALKVSIAAGASTDGFPWRIGAAYAFVESFAIAPPLQFPYRPRFTYPQLANKLINGQDAIASTGPGFHAIQLPFKPTDAQSLEETVRRARAGIVLLDLELANYPAQVWPVRHLEEEIDEGFEIPKESDVVLNLKEVV